MLRIPYDLDWVRSQDIRMITMDDHDEMGRRQVIAGARFGRNAPEIRKRFLCIWITSPLSCRN
ncbi:MAG: hypothetical protein ACR2PM_08615 [Hyphomicrobiales bacterium]